jgi:hypothetical protein
MQYYAHKKFLVRFDEMQEDGVLDTQCASIPFLKGDKLATDYYGNKKVVSKGQDDEYYVPVELIKKENVSKDNMEEEYKQSWVSDEDEEYIKGTRKISKL